MGRTADERRLDNARKRAFVREWKAQPCCDCNGSFHYAAMQFDHVRGEKLFELSSLNGRTWRQIDVELGKCDVVCANCHAVRTFERGTCGPSAPLRGRTAEKVAAEAAEHLRVRVWAQLS